MAMTKQINYQVRFNPDTSAVQSAVANLQTTLQTIGNTPIVFDSSGLVQAKQNAQELSQILQKATNVNTGNLDISKFSQQLKTSGKDLSTYMASLQKLGPSGQQAFMQLAQSIGQAHVPIRTTNKLLSSLWINLKNVAKWQISSNILMGFTSSIGNAVQYTKDLNKNLNDIRIVSGQSAGQMEKFAESANKAAKALSASTNEYTKAALIYYQQGLNDQQVKERTDATIKMANVTGESADDVSSYMTAIWNNFDNGSKSLEYYADVMTALGAATASSTDEIATGLEKFAGIAETVGLSYEYATSALATLIAETRQSPETVGTALKTIFSRLQGLKLGETLDDGTSLNKYSEALLTVGVNIKNSNGELKDMDVILNELGNRWDYIGKAEKMALAQTVGGIRQYTQLITLMDNWDEMQKNVGIAMDSTGELDKQAEIYAQSWEAASERTKASLEALYSELVPEDLLINFTDTMGVFVDSITALIDGVGGLGPILLMTFGLLVSKFLPQLIAGGASIVSNMAITLGFGEKQTLNVLQQAEAELRKSGILKSNDTIYKEMLSNTQKIVELRQYELENANNITNARKQDIEAQIEQLNNENNLLAALKRRNQESQRQAQNAVTTGGQYAHSQGYDTTIAGNALKAYGQDVAFDTYLNEFGFNFESENNPIGSPNYQDNTQNRATARNFIRGQGELASRGFEASYNISIDKYLEQYNQRENLQKQIDSKSQILSDNENHLNNMKENRKNYSDKEIQSVTKAIEKQKAAIKELQQEYEKLGGPLDKAEEQLAETANKVKEMTKLADQDELSVDELATSYDRLTNEIMKNSQARIDKTGEAATELNGQPAVRQMTDAKTTEARDNAPFLGQNKEPDQNDIFNEAKKQKADGYNQAIQGVTSALSGAYMAMSAIQSLGSIWNNDDITIGEKLMSILMSMSMLLPGITSAWGGYKSMMQGFAKVQKNKQIMDALQPKLEKNKQNAMLKSEAIEDANQADDKADMAQDLVGGVAESFKQAGPLGAIVGGAIALAIGGIAIAGIAGAISKAKSQNAQEEINKYQEAKQESVEKQSSYSTFKQEYEKWKQTGEVTNELKKSAEAAGEAFGIVETSTLALTNNFDSLNEQIEALAQQDLESIIGKGNSAERASLYLLQQSILKGQGHKSNGNLVDTMRSSGSAGDVKIARMVNQGNYKYLKTNSKGDLSYNVDLNDPKQLLGLIEEFNTLSNQAAGILSTNELKNASLYTKLQDQLYEDGDLVSTAETLENTINETDLSELEYYYKYENKDTTSEEMSQADYEDFRAEMIDWAKDNEIDEKNVLKFLADMNQEQEAIATSKDNQLKIMNWDKEELDNLWSDEFSLGIKVYPNMTKEAYQEALKQAQNIADTDKNYLVINAKVGALKDLDKLSAKEFQEKYLTPGKSEYLNISADVFFSMSKEEQKDFLEEETGGFDLTEVNTSASSMISAARNIDSLNASMNEAENTYKKYTTSSENFSDYLKDLNFGLNEIQDLETDIITYNNQIEKETKDIATATAAVAGATTIATVAGTMATAATIGTAGMAAPLAAKAGVVIAGAAATVTAGVMEIEQSTEEIIKLNSYIDTAEKDIEKIKNLDQQAFKNIKSSLENDETFWNWFNSKGYDDTKFADNAEYRAQILNGYMAELAELEEASEEAKKAYEANLTAMTTNLNNFTTNSLAALGNTENLEQHLKVINNIMKSFGDFENALNSSKFVDHEAIGLTSQFQKVTEKSAKELLKFKNSIPGVSNEVSELEKILKDKGIESLEDFSKQVEIYTRKILAAAEATEHFQKFAGIYGAIGNDFQTINKAPNGQYIETQQSFSNVENWLLNNFGISTDTETLKAKWIEFSTIIQNTAGKSIAEVQGELNILFNGSDEQGLIDDFKELANITGEVDKEIQELFNNLDLSTPEGLKKLKESLDGITSTTQKLSVLMTILPGLVPKNLQTKYTILTQSIDESITKDINDNDTVDQNLISAMLTDIDKGEFTEVTKENLLSSFEKDESGNIKLNAQGRAILKDDLYFRYSINPFSNYLERYKQYLDKINTDTETEINALFKNAGLIFSQAINEGLTTGTAKPQDTSFANKLFDSETMARYRGQLAENEKAIESYEKIVNSSIKTDEEKKDALDEINKKLTDQIKLYEDIGTEAEKLANSRLDELFNEGSKSKENRTLSNINKNTVFKTKNGKEITLATLDDTNYLNDIYKGLDLSESSEEDKEVLMLRIDKAITHSQNATQLKLTGITDSETIKSIQDQGAEDVEALKHIKQLWEDYFTYKEEQRQASNKKLKSEEQRNENKLKEIELNGYKERERIRAQENQLYELQLARTEDTIDPEGLASRIEVQGKKAQSAMDEWRDAVQKFNESKDYMSDEQRSEALIKIMEKEQSAIEAQKEAYQELNNVLEKYQENLDHIAEIPETGIDIMNNYKDILDNIFQENSKAISALNEQLITSSIGNLGMLREQRDYNKQVVAELQKLVDEAKARGDQVAVDEYTNQLNEATSKYRESEKELVSELSSTLEEITSIYEETLEQIVEDWNKAAGGIMSNLEMLSDEFDKRNDLNEQYLDEETQIYELEKMRRTINKELANNKNLVAQSKLQDVMEQINKIQREGIKLSEYDLKMLQARYDLRKAEIALEEAQNNKTEARLVRNAQGNWTYVFTANQNAIEDAEQKVADEREKARNESEKYSEEMQKNLVDLEKERQEALAEAYKEYKDDEVALKKETERLNAYYVKRFNYFGSELGKALKVLGIDFKDTSYAVLKGYDSWTKAQEDFKEKGINATSAMEAALVNFKSSTSAAMQAAGYNMNTFATDLQTNYLPRIDNAITTAFENFAEACDNQIEALKAKVKEVMALIESLMEQQEDIYIGTNVRDFPDYVQTGYHQGAQLVFNGKSYWADKDYTNSTQATYVADDGTKVTLDKNSDTIVNMTSGGNKSSGKGSVTTVSYRNAVNNELPQGGQNTTITVENAAQAITVLDKNPNANVVIAQAATGMYTGDWNSSEGRLAILHEKELVLNKTDTKNILSAVDIMRNIIGNANFQSKILSNRFVVPKVEETNKQELQQEVHIEASFPGVQSAFEIETALNNIINDVSQYAGV